MSLLHPLAGLLGGVSPSRDAGTNPFRLYLVWPCERRRTPSSRTFGICSLAPLKGLLSSKGLFLDLWMQDYPLSHPFAGLSGSDNLITFTSSRYNSQPLVVRGPGAGAEVTAAGVFGDILTIAKRLPALRLPM